ncbi:Asp-tRNA(Asn)/Glu-tRNA(Gln) amidotransferase subunit GatB [Ignatzschineria sp. LJL83]
MSWEVVIGLEVHTQLTTKTKLFSGTSTLYGQPANTQAGIFDIALPGVLPMLNEAVIDKAIRLAIATNSKVQQRTIFERKHYFYPDLPKGYQTSQLDAPIVYDGFLMIETEDGPKKIRVNRAHLEEDAGSSRHGAVPGMTGIDLNRAGTPLLEIVSEPDLSSASEAISYLRQLHQIVTWLDISDGNMQEGSFRCDANVSIRKPGEPLGTRTELKNINSFRFIEQAINYEVARQIKVLESGGSITQETRLYDSDKNETRSMRAKAEANDYRYFHDPDLLPIIISDEHIEAVKASFPLMPDELKVELMEKYELSDYDAGILVQSRAMADYFTALLSFKVDPKMAVNWLLGDVSAYLNEKGLEIDELSVSAENLAGLLNRIQDKTISNNIAKKVFGLMIERGNSADEIIEREGLKQVTDTGAIEGWVDDIIAKNPKQVEQFKSGQTKILGFFVGQVMKLSQGKADPAAINKIIIEKLNQ